MSKEYAKTSWCVDDLMTMWPDQFTELQAELFLQKYENHIIDAMVSAGWTTLEIIKDAENGE
jgi:hypothetical protein